MLDCVVCKEKETYYLILFYIVLYDFINCAAFANIKQTLRYKLAIE